MAQVVVLGGGIAGIPAAYQLRRRLDASDTVTVVSDRDQFRFVPSNPWVAVGLRERADVAFPIGEHLRRRGIEFRADPVVDIDPKNQRVSLRSGTELGYDYLLLATGIVPAWGEVSGLQPGPRLHSVIRLEEAAEAAEAYQSFLRRPGPLVVGATQQASILGPIYEYAFLADADLRRRGLRGRVPITLVTPEPFPGHLGLGNDTMREPLQQALARHDIQWIGNAETTVVNGESVKLRVHGGDGPQTREVAFDYAVYWPAFRGVEACRGGGGLCDDRGLLAVNGELQASGFANVFGVGTCLARPPAETTAVPVGVPESVYSIQQEVDAAVHNIVASRHGRALMSAQPARAHWIEDMGPHGATYLSAPHVPLRNINWLHGGRWVYQAKQALEDYFINQVILGPGEHGQVVGTVRRWLAEPGGAEPAGTPPQSLRIPLEAQLRYELQGLARLAGKDPREVAEGLLRAALEEARGALGEEDRNRLTRHYRESLVSELEAESSGVQFEGGAP